MSRRRVSAIVLAGGRSSRFGRDKLAEPIGGRALLQHAIDSVRPFASEVLVVVAPDASPEVASDVLVVHDPSPFEGPLAGLLAGLGRAREPTVLVIGGDMPSVMPAVVECVLASLESTGRDAAVLDHAGQARPLPMAIRRDPARAAAARLIEAGERRLRALTDALATTVIAEATWRALDPDGRTMRDIDTPDDLR
ncbi:MAG: molybdenum cofactor guanylyltransferase [Candidatus Limnocylindrales bacterium]|nr:molybdenum cofactor guanylyltransferase [Candidatus Limnocylindrales bacterium]